MRNSRTVRLFGVILAAILLISSQACQPRTSVLSLGRSPAASHPNASDTLEARLSAHIKYLASEECAGRKVGSEGDRAAAAYVADELSAMGLEPLFDTGFVQELPAKRAAEATASLEILENEKAIHSFEYHDDFSELIYPSWGTTTVTGKLVVDSNERPPLENTVLLMKAPVQDAISEAQHSPSTGLRAVLYVDPAAKKDQVPMRYSTKVAMPNIFVPVFRVEPRCYARLSENPGATVRLSVTSSDHSGETAWNIGACLGDPDKEGAIVVVAHRDHMGTLADGTIFPGAVDNCSGTSAVIEIARCLSRERLQKAVVFLSVDGEEIGLVGTEFFLDNLPFPGNNLDLAVNFDCVAVKGDGPLMVTTNGGQPATELAAYAKECLAESGFKCMDARPEDLASDHLGFMIEGYPAVGILESMDSMLPYLHKTSDTPEAVDVVELAKTVSALAEAIARTAK